MDINRPGCILQNKFDVVIVLSSLTPLYIYSALVFKHYPPFQNQSWVNNKPSDTWCSGHNSKDISNPFLDRHDCRRAFKLCKCLLQLSWQQHQFPPLSLWPMGVIRLSSTLAFIEAANLDTLSTAGFCSIRSCLSCPYCGFRPCWQCL